MTQENNFSPTYISKLRLSTPGSFPSRKTILTILKKLHLSSNIINHQIVVMKKALDLAYNITKTDVDIETVRVGALVHDIGRYKTHGMSHGVEGGILLRFLGFSESIARIAETHSLTGLTAEEAVMFNLPARNFCPQTIEEKLVCLADKYHMGTRKVTIEHRFEKWFLKYGETPFLRTQLQRAKDLEEEILRLIF